MLFSSITFIYYFLPLLLILYFIVPKKYKNLVLLIFESITISIVCKITLFITGDLS